MEDIKREIYEQDAIDEKIAIAEQERMEARGMVKCKKCDCWVYEDELYNGLCNSCIDERVDDTTLEEVFEYASTLYDANDKVDNELTLYTEYLFTREQAIEILKEYARNTEPKGIFKNDIKDYIENDTSHYIDYLEEKGDL